MKTTTTKLTPFYTISLDIQGVELVGTAMLEDEPRDIYIMNDGTFNNVIVVHGNEPWEYSSFHELDFKDYFKGTPTYELAKFFYKITNIR